jgi:hypothetical protein
MGNLKDDSTSASAANQMSEKGSRRQFIGKAGKLIFAISVCDMIQPQAMAAPPPPCNTGTPDAFCSQSNNDENCKTTTTPPDVDESCNPNNNPDGNCGRALGDKDEGCGSPLDPDEGCGKVNGQGVMDPDGSCNWASSGDQSCGAYKEHQTDDNCGLGDPDNACTDQPADPDQNCGYVGAADQNCKGLPQGDASCGTAPDNNKDEACSTTSPDVSCRNYHTQDESCTAAALRDQGCWSNDNDDTCGAAGPGMGDVDQSCNSGQPFGSTDDNCKSNPTSIPTDPDQNCGVSQQIPDADQNCGNITTQGPDPDDTLTAMNPFNPVRTENA